MRGLNGGPTDALSLFGAAIFYFVPYILPPSAANIGHQSRCPITNIQPRAAQLPAGTSSRLFPPLDLMLGALFYIICYGRKFSDALNLFTSSVRDALSIIG
jgi:hypothetical protein